MKPHMQWYSLTWKICGICKGWYKPEWRSGCCTTIHQSVPQLYLHKLPKYDASWDMAKKRG